MLKRRRRIKGHVRFILVFAQPRRHIVVPAIAILVEDYNDRPHLALNFLNIADEDLAVMPVADGLPQINPVQQRNRKWLYSGPFLRQNTLPFLLQKAPEIFNHHVFRRVGTNALPFQFFGPLTGNLFFPAPPQSEVAHAPFGTGQPPPQTNAFGMKPNFFARNVHRL